MVKRKAISKVVAKRLQGTDADEYTIETKGGKRICFSITERYVLIHHDTNINDITFSESLKARIHSYNIDATIYQLDLN
jgi:hypothetical protein